MLTIEEARTRVASGSAYLDEHRPGWFKEIDTGTLSMSSSCLCVMGQLAGASWIAGDIVASHPRLLPAITLDDPRTCTYTTEPKADYAERTADYRVLQEAWIEAIADRLLCSVSAARSEGSTTDRAGSPRSDDVGVTISA